MDASGENFRILTASLDRTCDPYPEIREPIWDGDSIVFAIEDRGNIHVYRVSPDGGEPELARRRRHRPLRLRRPRRDASPAPARPRPNLARAPRRREAADGDRQGVRRRTRAERAGALHGRLEGRLRGRGLDRPPRRLRGGQDLPGAPEHPRRPVHPVRQRLLRRDAGLRRRRLRRHLCEPARLVGLHRGAGAARSWARASSARAGARSTTRT